VARLDRARTASIMRIALAGLALAGAGALGVALAVASSAGPQLVAGATYTGSGTVAVLTETTTTGGQPQPVQTIPTPSIENATITFTVSADSSSIAGLTVTPFACNFAFPSSFPTGAGANGLASTVQRDLEIHGDTFTYRVTFKNAKSGRVEKVITGTFPATGNDSMRLAFVRETTSSSGAEVVCEAHATFPVKSS